MEIKDEDKMSVDEFDKLWNEQEKEKAAVSCQRPISEDGMHLNNDISSNSNSIYITDRKFDENDFTFFPSEDKSILYNFLNDKKIINSWGLLNFYNKKNLQGNFTRFSNYIRRCLNLADITFSEYKLYTWVYDNTVGKCGIRENKVDTDLQFYKQIANECGMSESSAYKAINKLYLKKMVYIHQRNVVKYGKKISIDRIRCNMFPDLWEDVGPKVKQYIDQWITEKKKNIGFVKRSFH
jgi:hypothetical protein